MGKALHKLDLWMDDFTIKKKFYIFYVVCVLIPLIVTDSVVFLTTAKFDRERREHEMSNIASAVEYSLSSMIGNAGEIGNSIYTNRDFEEFLSKRYTNSAEYVAAYQNFLSGTLLENALGMNSMIFTLYTDNDTIVNGGRVNTLDKLRNTESYLQLNEEAKSKGLFFVYDDSSSRITRERRVIYLQRLDFYDAETEKYLKIEFDYGSMVRIIKNMNYDNEVLICEGDRILLSNGQYGSYGSEFQRLDNATIRDAYEHTISLYGTDLTIYVKPVENSFLTSIRNELPIILLLLVANVIFPFWFVQIFNRSFTKRITELSRVFKSVDSDHLIPMPCEDGKDEISSMIRNYNRMVERTNGLIETVYKNKIREQEILVGRKNAELLALHSQINPHFLFNVLESIRMHSILKKENETADMVSKLAVMQRQYVEWGNDSVSIFQEIEFVKAYLALQKYRFGERLNYDIEVDRECENFKIPKLTIVTFVENACVHGMDQYFDLIEKYNAANPTMEDGTANIPYTILCDDWRYFCLENAPQFLDGYPNDGSCMVDPETLTVLDYNTSDTAVKYFRKLNEEYKKGIVDPESFTQSYDEYISKLSTGRVLGMIDQWWDFAYTAGDAIKQAGLDAQGCDYIPLPITIDESVKNQWHNAGGAFNSGSGLAITVSCKDVPGALKLINDLLDQDIHNLRFWGVEGVDYEVDENGEFYRTPEQRMQASDTEYKASHMCSYSYFPQYNGTSDDGINANKPDGQAREFFDGLNDDVKEAFQAYGAETYVEMLGTNEAPGEWYPMWSFSNNFNTSTPGGMAWTKIGEVKHEYLPQVVMAADFDKAWADYMDAYNACKPEDFISELQAELDSRMELAAKFK